MMSTSDTSTTTTTTSRHDPPSADQTTTTRDQQHVDDQYLDSFPVGYRFMPTDEEVLHYLTLRYQKKKLPPNRINEINLYDHHPEYLTSPGRFKAYENEEWYFFTPRDRKYRNGNRPKRSAGKGYWKATGVDKKIMWDEVTKEKLGSMKTLVFYEGKPPKGIKTSWVMKEFKLDQTSIQKNSRADMRLDDYVLCKIRIKKIKPSDSTTSSGSRKKKSVHNDHSLSSLAEEDGDDHLREEEDFSVRGETNIYNDMEDDHMICSNYDSIVQQYYPIDLHEILNNNSTCSTTANSSNVMGAVSSSSTTFSATVRGAANSMPLQTCPPNWVSSLSVRGIPAGHPPLPDQQWVSSLSVRGIPTGHPPLPDQQWVSSLSVRGIPAGHPPLPQMLQMPPQMSPQMPSHMQQQDYHHHHQYSSSWADRINNIDGSSSSGINKLHDHGIRCECRERHMGSNENDNNSTTEHSEYFNVGENLESFDQTAFSKTFNGSTLPDCGWSRRR